MLSLSCPHTIYTLLPFFACRVKQLLCAFCNIFNPRPLSSSPATCLLILTSRRHRLYSPLKHFIVPSVLQQAVGLVLSPSLLICCCARTFRLLLLSSHISFSSPLFCPLHFYILIIKTDIFRTIPR